MIAKQDLKVLTLKLVLAPALCLIAAGIIGADTVAKSAPDGYTLLMGGSGALAINPGLRAKMPYDPQKDFAPVSLFASIPFKTVGIKEE